MVRADTGDYGRYDVPISTISGLTFAAKRTPLTLDVRQLAIVKCYLTSSNCLAHLSPHPPLPIKEEGLSFNHWHASYFLKTTMWCNYLKDLYDLNFVLGLALA